MWQLAAATGLPAPVARGFDLILLVELKGNALKELSFSLSKNRFWTNRATK